MDPITLAVLTSGVVTLATETIKGAASEAGKNAWEKIKSLFAWKTDPDTTQLARQVAESLNTNTQLAQQVMELLKQPATGTAASLVSTINAEKVVVANKIDTLNM